MSNEICVTASLSGYKSSVMSSPKGGSKVGALFTMTGSVVADGVVSVGTAEEAIPVGEVTTPHWAWFYNPDSTNYVRIRPGPGLTPLIRLYPGEFCVVPLDQSATLYAIADTAAVALEYVVFAK